MLCLKIVQNDQMKKKKTPAKHIPTRNLVQKGRFGNNGYYDPDKKKKITFPESLNINDEQATKRLFSCINRSLENNRLRADFSKLTKVEIRCGIILRAYADEFRIKFGHAIDVIEPINKKARAILRYVHVLSPDDSYLNYPDLKCWNILMSEDTDEEKPDIARILCEEFIPKCWANHDSANPVTQNIAEAVAEIYYNCSEHAYGNLKRDSKFKRWYIGAGEYPESNNFTFCVYDKGQGFKQSMLKNRKWFYLARDKKDSYYILKATEGYSRGNADGRGLGIPSSINLIKEVNGAIDIISGKGHYSCSRTSQTNERNVYLKGSLVSFMIPIEGSKP